MKNGFILAFLVLVLGMRHGLDPDHIFTIDAITRNLRSKICIAKLVGLLFSMGHGSIVILLSILVAIGIKNTYTPVWLENFGNFISAFFLMLFGIINLVSLSQTKIHNPIRLRGIISMLLGNFAKRINHPLLIVAVGAMFAFSFDTVTQATVFSLSASAMSGWIFSATLGIVFTLGMMMSDGINGIFIAKLINYADNNSLKLSYLLGLIISLTSILIAMFSIFKIIHS